MLSIEQVVNEAGVVLVCVAAVGAASNGNAHGSCPARQEAVCQRRRGICDMPWYFSVVLDRDKGSVQFINLVYSPVFLAIWQSEGAWATGRNEPSSAVCIEQRQVVSRGSDLHWAQGPAKTADQIVRLEG